VSARWAVLAALVAAAVPVTRARAQYGGGGSREGGYLLQGIVDGEAWSTDTMSNLLSRNGGDPAILGRLTLWAAAEPHVGWVLYAQGEAVEGTARAQGHEAADLEQLGVRYTRSPRAVVDIGKITYPVGGFAARRFSNRNPLIGEPDGYPVEYPVGAQISGSDAWLDYRAAVVSLPVYHVSYQPAPSASPRPVFGLGVTPTIGVRLGASATWGPYLNHGFATSDLDGSGRSWRDFHQRVVAFEASASRGYLETHAELGTVKYDVPTLGTSTGMTGYVEAKYTLAARWFVAARGEVNDYPFISSFAPGRWVASRTDLRDYEAGVGYRLGLNTLLKASYRWDAWDLTPDNYAFVRPGGHAVAVQVSRAFDVLSWFASEP
jgi:hypothetical protein